MKRNEKGFTLIELLAVIIILAIIALIAIPTITSIIDKSRLKAAEDSTYGVISAIELWYSTEMLNNNGDSPLVSDGTVSCNGTACTVAIEAAAQGVNRTIAVKGDVPSAGSFSVNANDGSATIPANTSVTVNSKYCIMTNGKVSCSNDDPNA